MRKSPVSSRKRTSRSTKKSPSRRRRYSREQLKSMTVPKLRKLASKKCSTSVSSMNKSQLVRALSPKKRTKKHTSHHRKYKKSSKKSPSRKKSPTKRRSSSKRKMSGYSPKFDDYMSNDVKNYWRISYGSGYSPSNKNDGKSNDKSNDKSKKHDICSQIEKSKGWYLVKMKGCPYCTNAEDDLKKHKQHYKSVTLDKRNEKSLYTCVDKQYKQGSINGIKDKKYRFFPMIYKDGKFIGGYGELKQMIDKEH